MATLKRTPLRHRMLAEVARADRPVSSRRPWDPGKPMDYVHAERELTAAEVRTLRDLYDHGLHASHGAVPARWYAPRQREETKAGAALLSEWNDKHGNPLT